MTKFTRRTFVKRSGATLGGALALGLLPSLTRKLHALDTSTSQGLRVFLGPPVPESSAPFAGGTLTLQTTLTATSLIAGSSPPTTHCVPSVCVTATHTAEFRKQKNGKSYRGLHTVIECHYWQCENNAPKLMYKTHYEFPMDANGNPKPAVVANVSDPKDTIGTVRSKEVNNEDGTQTSTTASVVVDDADGKAAAGINDLPPIYFANYTATCCPLS